MTTKEKTLNPKDAGKTKKELLEELSKLRDRVRKMESDFSGSQPSQETSRAREEVAALLKGSRAVLENRNFPVTAQIIFDTCKDIIGATSGYVALLSKDGTENEVLFLDPGGLPCTVDPALPMPIRGLRETSYRGNKVAYENDFHNSRWMSFMPSGHVHLKNVLFSPLVIEGETVGLLGLGNKPTDFTENDARLAKTFGEYAALALHNSRTLKSLENSEIRFRSLADTANDAIISMDSRGKITFWNPAASSLFGYTQQEALEQPLTLIMPKKFREAHSRAMKKAVSGKGLQKGSGPLELIGLKKDGREFPLELSIALWKNQGELFFTGILRDITDRKQAEENLRNAKENLEIKVQERTSELFKINKQLQEEMKEKLRAEEKIRTALSEKEVLLSEIHHRVKNNMQIISSLLHLQSKSIQDAKYLEMFDESQNRIKSMALIHEKLYSAKDLASIDFKEYIQSLAKRLFQAYETASRSVSLELYLEDIAFEIDTAVPCGLIINELLTNSIKYAFPNENKGRIKIALRKIDTSGTYELLVSDDGVGLPKDLDIHDSKSLGLQLIQQLSTKQLNGHMEFYGNNGTEFRIHFKERTPEKRR